MAGTLTLPLVQQLHLDVALPRLLAQVVMAHQTIEVEWRGCTRIGLQGGHFWQFLHGSRQIVDQVGCYRQGCPLRHIHHHIEFRLVIQRQHFHRDSLEGVEQGHQGEKHHDNPQQQGITFTLVLNQRQDNATEQTLQTCSLFVLLLRIRMQLFQTGLEQVGQPRCESKRGKQGNDHGNRTQDRDRHHVRPHHATDKPHGQQSSNNRGGCQNGRVAHLTYCINGNFQALLTSQQPTPVYIFHHHDGIIDQNANRENQGKQAHPVNGHPQCPRHKHRGGNDRRNNNQHHQPCPPCQGDPHQHGDNQGGNQQFFQEFIDFGFGGRSVITGNGNMDIIRDNLPFQTFQLFQDGL